MKKKLSFVLILLSFLLTVITSCGGDSGTDKTEKMSVTASEEPSAETAEKEETAEPEEEETEPPKTPEEEAAESEALLGCSVDISADGLENDIWSGTITLNGAETEVAFPVKVGSNGETVLIDDYRKIILVQRKEGADNELSPCVIDTADPDKDALLTYYSFIEICDLLGTAGWSNGSGDGETELPADLISSLDNTGIPADRLIAVGDIDGQHLFRFSSLSGDDKGYSGLFKSLSGIFANSGEGYTLIVK